MIQKLFLSSIAYDKTMENGVIKRVAEQYVVDSLNFIEAENRIIKEMNDQIGGEFDVVALKRIRVDQVLNTEEHDEHRWFRVKVASIVMDEKTGAEKELPMTMLIHSESLAIANAAAVAYMDKMDFRVISIAETKILGFFGEENEDE